MKKYLEAGKAVSTHGTQGELKIYPWCDSAEILCGIKTLYLDDGGKRPLEIVSARPHKKMALIRFRGFSDIDEARKLIDRTLYIDREDVPLEEGAHFVADMIGLRVIDADAPETVYGTLCDVTNNGAYDIYHIELQDGRTGLMPAIRHMIGAIDAQKGYVSIRPPKGLFEP